MKEVPLEGYDIDFDNTICDTRFNPDTGAYDMGEPLPYMIDAVNRCATEHPITIFTARPEEEWDQVREWLDIHGVVYDGVTNIKKPAIRYVDDRAQTPETFIGVWNPKR